MLCWKRDLEAQCRETQRLDLQLADLKERSDVLDQACGVGLWQAVLFQADALHPKSAWTWSPEFRRLIGYETVAEFPDLCQSWSDRLHPEDAPRTFEAFGNHLKDRTGKARYDVTYRLKVRDGSYRWFRATGGCKHAADGVTIRACGSLTDVHAQITAVEEATRADRAAIEVLARALEALSEGDLTSRIEVALTEKTEPLRHSFNAAAEKLEQVLSGVSGATRQVAGAVDQIVSSSQAVATGASQQASALEETGSSLESMSSMTRQSADSAQQASGLATAAKGAATDGSAAMDQMMVAMAKIKAAAEGTSQIIKDINEIAFQTNLLALNAAVEAARAGEAGRGFAVVAEEVRSLALRSKEAANKTEELIRQSVREAGGGEVTARQVNEKLAEIVASVSKVTDIVAEISASAREQAAGIDQVTRATTQMSTVTQQNAASSEQSSAAAAELSGQADELARMVGVFQLHEQSAARAPAAPARALAQPARALPAPPKALARRPLPAAGARARVR